MKSITSILFLILVAMSNSWAANLFYYTAGSPRTSYIAQSTRGVTLSPENGWTFAQPRKVYESSKAMSFNLFTSSRYMTINFEAPNDEILGNGNFIATRFPFQDPERFGFSWYIDSYGLNTSTSLVNVLEVEYNATGVITKFAADFVQVEETWGRLAIDYQNDRWAYGSLRYNSSIPINTVPIPEPAGIMLGLGVSLFALRRRH